MRPAEFYKDREQTYLKHFFLEKYLQTVAFHIVYAFSDFVYADGFSGPWRAQGEDLADTSFRIALDQLNYVRNALSTPPHNKKPEIRAIFVEAGASAFTSLQQAVQESKGGIDVEVLPGTFEENVPAILKYAGPAFTFFFIDPTGWTGFSMEKIKPVLQHNPGEVVINFMYDYINRFLNSRDPTTEASLDQLFGTEKWRVLRDVKEDRENTIVDFYRERIRAVGGFQFVTSTRILKPTQDRAYYHLIYATRNPKGIFEFRAVEKKAVAEQEKVRWTAKREAREEKTHQSEFPFPAPPTSEAELDQERMKQLRKAEKRILSLLQAKTLRYGQLEPQILEIPLVWESDLQQMLRDMQSLGQLEITGLGPRERKIKPSCQLRRSTQSS